MRSVVLMLRVIRLCVKACRTALGVSLFLVLGSGSWGCSRGTRLVRHSCHRGARVTRPLGIAMAAATFRFMQATAKTARTRTETKTF
jgi:hypothetical protein